MIALSRWLQKTNVAETTMDNEPNRSPGRKQILGKCFQVLLAVVIAVGMFVVPITTVHAAANIEFTDSGQTLGNSNSYHVSLADVDGDGDIDAFIANWNNQPNKVWLNDGSGNFTDSGQALGNSKSKDASLTDVDGDGDIDAFVANMNQPNKVWLNDGSGNFTDSGQALGNSSSGGVSLADVDGDGDVDAFVVNYCQPHKVWLNDGSGNFTESGQALWNSNSKNVSLADVDGDGDIDAFIAIYGFNKVWLNDGSGNFTESRQYLGNYKSYDVSLADVDGDGDIDAFVANINQPNKVWLNDGSGNFTDSGQALGNSNSKDVSLADVDGDGDIDAFVANFGKKKVWLNDGSGNFTDSGQAFKSFYTFDASLADVDGDGDVDAFVANYNIWPNKVWLNNLYQYINVPPTNLTLSNTTIEENLPANSFVGTLSTTDTDNNTFTYQLVSGNGDTDNSAFAIDGEQLKINDSPDYETQSSYSILVQTTDLAGGTFEKTFTISINDIVEQESEIIINIDAQKNNQKNPVIQSIKPGTYKTHLIDTSSGGKFDAWNTVSYEKGCDPNGENCENGWESRYYFKSPYNKVTDTSCSQPQYGSCRYSSAAKAAANYPLDVVFTISKETDMKFYIYDSKDLNDNQGGISLEIIKE